MADDPLAQLNVIGQKALGLPTELLSVGARRVTEDVGILNAKIMDMGATLTPPSGLALPSLPLPGMQGAQEAPAPRPATRSEATQGVRPRKQMSYLKV